MRVLKFGAEWCGACKKMSEDFKDLPENYKKLITEVDCEEDDDLTTQYKVRNLPTLIFLDEEDNVLDRRVGSITNKDFINIVNNIDHAI